MPLLSLGTNLCICAFVSVAEFRCGRCKSARVLSFSEMEIVGNSITEMYVAMELCKKVQAEEYDIHVEGSTNFYTHLQFSLLASTWFPRPLGVCLWSALHMLLVLYEALMLLALLPIAFVLAVLTDALIVAIYIYLILLFPFCVITVILFMGIGIAVIWLLLVITCQCCTMPGRAPGQSLGNYFITAGGIFKPRQEDPQPSPARASAPAPVVEGGGAAAAGPFACVGECCRDCVEECCSKSFTRRFVNHVILVTFPYRRAQMGNLCREIVPWCDAIVI